MARDPVLEAALQRRLTVKRIANLCGVSSQAVSQWRRVPERHVWAVSRVTGIPAAQLRPDLRYYQPPKLEAAE